MIIDLSFLKKSKKFFLIGFLIFIFFINIFLLIKFLYPVKYYDIILENSIEYNLKPEFICAVINSESRFNKYAKSYKNASGLMQIKKTTADWAAREIDIKNYDYKNIFDENINIKIGCWYLDNLFKEFKNKDLVICAYNAGSGNVSEWLKNKKYITKNKSIIKIPFDETKKYLKKVKKFEKIYKFLISYNG
ncbi:MAG: lytic transglycosylase domain-containing protein [Clostridiales bacterium]|nr:lytic transglycosylase domain-containing protein [Clostridiales bacterium]